MRRLLKTLPLLALGLTGIAQATTFEITVTNHGPQPLSPMFFSLGDNTFDIFKLGTAASVGIKKIAEGGNTADMLAIANAAGPALSTYGVVGGSPLAPGLSRTMTFDTDVAHGYFSFAMMLGKTNDGFLGESVSSQGLNVFTGGVATGFSVNIFGDRAWDAGTEENTQNAADLGFLGGSGNPADPQNFVRVHQSIIPNVGDSWDQMPDWNATTELATVTVHPVPEPATMAGLGVAGLAFLRRRKKS